MKLAIVALTKGGAELASCLRMELAKGDIYLPKTLDVHSEGLRYDNSLRDLVGRLFVEYDGIVFIMALGIVARVIAPFLKDKRSDPAVITMDETGRYVISTLSGHLGGANRLAKEISRLIGAEPVITTATDCKGKLAFDLLAQRLGCEIYPFENLKFANGALVNGDKVNIFSEMKIRDKDLDGFELLALERLGEVEGFPVIISNRIVDLKMPYLQLIPKNIIVGIGCRKGIEVDRIAEAVQLALQEVGLRIESIKAIATVDLKVDEEGIISYAEQLSLPVSIVSREEIKKVQFQYTKSDFVKDKIGVGGVCEPVAMLSARQPRLLLPKMAQAGVTVAVVEEGCSL